MELEGSIIDARNFYYTYTTVSITIVKPKAAAKALGGLAVFIFVSYCHSMLGKSSSIGMGSKDRMINQTIGRNK